MSRAEGRTGVSGFGGEGPLARELGAEVIDVPPSAGSPCVLRLSQTLGKGSPSCLFLPEVKCQRMFPQRANPVSRGTDKCPDQDATSQAAEKAMTRNAFFSAMVGAPIYFILTPGPCSPRAPLLSCTP